MIPIPPDLPGAEKIPPGWGQAAAIPSGAPAALVKPDEPQDVSSDAKAEAAYLALHQPERAIGMLQQSERELPDDYNPSARLAVAYRKAGRYAESIAASGRALLKAYGPRKLRVYSDRAETCVQMGDPAAARATLEEAIAYAKSLPQAQRREQAISSLEKKLAALPPPPPAP